MNLARLFAALALLLLIAASPGHAQQKHFVIVHSNDTHGHLIPYSLPSRVPQTDRTAALPYRKSIGGIARRATIINQIRKENKVVKCFDAGDNMDGTLFSTEYRDKADYAMLNAMNYDYCVTGNHEYSLTAGELRALLPTVTAKVLVANVTDRKTKATIANPYVIDYWDGVKVAVIGLVTPETKAYPAAKEAFDVEDPLAVAKRLVPQLRKKADLVVLVTHIGVALDQKIAAHVPGIDVIVGGHSHTRLPHGIYQATNAPGPADPKGTVIVQTGAWGAELGKLDVTLTKTNGRWTISNYRDTLLPLTASVPDDPAVARALDHYWKPLQAKYRDTLGVASADFTDFDGEPSTNYYLVSDACSNAGACQFSLLNLGGVRAPLLQGPVTRYDLASMMPFADTLYTATIRGASLDSALNETFAQPSGGLHYTIHHWMPDTLHHTEERWRVGEILIGGKPLEPEATYTFSASDYYLHSIESHVLTSRSTGRPMIDVLCGYVAKQKQLTPAADDRIKVKEE